MDASNPVMTSDRVKLVSIAEQATRKRRQNLAALRQKLEVSERRLFSSIRPYYELELFKRLRKHALPTAGALDLSFLKEIGPCPIDQEQYEGRQIHPPAVNSLKGNVSTVRRFGDPQSYDTILTAALTSTFSHDEIVEAYSKYSYCYGTPQGFSTRLRMLTTRSCKSPFSPKEVAKRLKRLLPMDTLPDWHDFEDLMYKVEVTFSAGAGAPYFKTKQEAYFECVNGVLPQLIHAINTNTVHELQRKRPEWFLVEIKNKLDRYEVSKLDKKCRPYGNMPMHIAILASMIIQPATKALHKWTKNPESHNAYGMSFAGGEMDGLMDILRRKQASAKREVKYWFGCYGDDAKIFKFEKDGTIWSVDPDFKQMDGSVDRKTVEGVAQWLYTAYEEATDESPFWKTVLSMWVEIATDPLMIIHGDKTYRKTQKDGIISGVVGTTLLDTAKAVLAYDDLVEQFQYGSSFTDEAAIRKFMIEKHGLEIKEGTWNVVRFYLPGDPEAPFWTSSGEREDTPYRVVSENKFLGMRLAEIQGQVVPVLNDMDWLDLLMCPREKIDFTGRQSEHAKQRRSFDRARGLIVTGAVFSPNIYEVLKLAIDQVPNVAIAMDVTAGEGTGSTDFENAALLAKDFRFPLSDGVPTYEWVLDLYAGRERQPEGFLEVFPTIKDWLRTYKSEERGMRFVVAPITRSKADEPQLAIKAEKPPIPPPLPEFFVATSFAPVGKYKTTEEFPKRQPLQGVTEYISKGDVPDPGFGIRANKEIDQVYKEMDSTSGIRVVVDNRTQFLQPRYQFKPLKNKQVSPTQNMIEFLRQNKLKHVIHEACKDVKKVVNQVTLFVEGVAVFKVRQERGRFQVLRNFVYSEVWNTVQKAIERGVIPLPEDEPQYRAWSIEVENEDAKESDLHITLTPQQLQEIIEQALLKVKIEHGAAKQEKPPAEIAEQLANAAKRVKEKRSQVGSPRSGRAGYQSPRKSGRGGKSA